MRLEDLWLYDKNLILTLRDTHSGWGVLKKVEASQLWKTRKGFVEELVFRWVDVPVFVRLTFRDLVGGAFQAEQKTKAMIWR